MRLFLLVLLAAFLLPAAMADTGPGPPKWIQIQAYVSFNGTGIPYDASVKAFCYRSSNMSDVESAEFQCVNSTCFNKGPYDLYFCYGNDLYFNISHSSFPASYTTPPVKIDGGGSQYFFNIELKPDGTALINPTVYNPSNYTYNSSNGPYPPQPGPVCPFAALLATVPLAAFLVRG